MKYFLIAGEASGDLHGANLVRELAKQDEHASFQGWGGDQMQAAGVVLKEHYKNTAFMGFLEVILHLRTILRFLSRCKREIEQYQPDALVLLDYPGFNLRIAKWATKMGFHVVYYITPQVWAWHQSRVHQLGKYTRLLLTILPFEKAFFKKYGYPAEYVGHPLLDAKANFQPDPQWTGQHHAGRRPVLALLPGSRKQEITAMLPVMLDAVKDLPYTILLAGAPAIPDELYNNIIHKYSNKENIILIKNKTYDILATAHIALVASGTATLETALFKVPQVVCYKGNALSVAIAKRLVNLTYISLVNLIADRQIVVELIQEECTAGRIKEELDRLEKDRTTILAEYDALIHMLGDGGASRTAASLIIQSVNHA